MEGAGADFLAGPGFARDQNAGVGAGECWNLFDLRQKNRTVTHELFQAEFFLQNANGDIFLSRFLDPPPNARQNIHGPERRNQKIVGAMIEGSRHFGWITPVDDRDDRWRRFAGSKDGEEGGDQIR